MLEYICDDIINIIIQNLDEDDVAQLRFSYIDAGNFRVLKRLDKLLIEHGFDLMYLNHMDYRETDEYPDEIDDDFHLWKGDYEDDDEDIALTYSDDYYSADYYYY